MHITNEWILNKAVILVIIIIYYIVTFLLISRCDKRWLGVMWSFPLPLLFITFLNGYCETEIGYYAKIIAIAYLLTAFLFFFYWIMVKQGVCSKIAIVLTIFLWAILAGIIFFKLVD